MVRAGSRIQLPASSCTASSWSRKIHCHISERNCKAEGKGITSSGPTVCISPDFQWFARDAEHCITAIWEMHIVEQNELSLNQVDFFHFSLKSNRGWGSGSPEPIKSIKSAGNVWLDMYDARYRYYSVRLSRAENLYKSQEELDIQTEKTTCNLPLHSSKMTM
jgi:hypothetical protein